MGPVVNSTTIPSTLEMSAEHQSAANPAPISAGMRMFMKLLH